MFELIHSLLHIDVTLIQWAQNWGPWMYAILFFIIFSETGLVFMPFLPGDSLLFAVGALAARPGFLSIENIIPLLILAAILGDSANYLAGKKIGRALFEKNLFFLKKSWLLQTEEFFARRGLWAVTLSRFFPIIRTISPFFAGLSTMPYKKFIVFSAAGSLIWVPLFAMAGYFFGQIEFIQKNFTYLVLGIILISVVPIVVKVVRSRLAPLGSSRSK